MYFKFKSFLKLIFIPLVFFSVGFSAHAATYYVDATLGSNSNNGTSVDTPWQTISKVNGTTRSPGDIVLFKKGETFTGQLSVNQSGTAGNMITYGAYGTGANPIFNAASRTNYEIYIDKKSYIRIENITVQNPTAASILLLTAASNIQMDSITTIGGPSGLMILGGGAFTDISMSNSNIGTFTSNAVQISATVNGLVLSNIQASGGQRGISIDGSTTNLTISKGSTFSGASLYGIELSASKTLMNLVISDSHFNLNGSQNLYLKGSINGATISDSSFDNNGGHGIYLNPSTSDTVQNFSITDSTVSNNGGHGFIVNGVGSGSLTGLDMNNVTVSGNAYFGIDILSTASDISITGSTVQANRWGGIQFDATSKVISGVVVSNTNSSNNDTNGFAFVGSLGVDAVLNNVTASTNENDGINIKGTWDVDINGCIANTNGIDGTAGDGDGVSYHNTSTGDVKYCFLSNNIKSAMAQVDDTDVNMYYNVMRHDTNSTIALLYLGGTGTYNAYNNIIYSGAQTGVGVEMTTPTGPTLTFKNNIIYGFDTGFKKTAGTLTEDYNLIYNTGTANYSGLTAGANSISVDPLFTNAGSNDFTLQSGSPAIDVGVTVNSTYDDALHPNTVFVSSVNTVDQDLRGAGWELGAYIYPVPQAPTIGAVDVLSDSSLKFNFTDNASDETGFKLYSNTDTLATTDATTNLSSLNATSLASNTGFSGYYVKAYNSYGNSVASSGSSIAYTLAPTPTSFISTLSSDSALLSVTEFTNDDSSSSGYYFENTTNSTNSGWIQTPSWTSSSLACSTPYSYSVKYRNQEGVETSVYTSTLNTSGCSRYGSYSPVVASYVPPKTVPIVDSSVGSIKTNGGGKVACNIPSADLNKFISNKKILKFGSRGEDVKILQSCLSSYGVEIYPAGIINGVFGPQTRQAVKNFQNKYSLKSDGIVGPKFKTQIELLK